MHYGCIMAALLDMRDLQIRDGTAEAVRGIDLQPDEGEVLGLVGKSGSGKSATVLANSYLPLFLLDTGLAMKTLREVGVRPLLQGVLLWIAVAAGSPFDGQENTRLARAGHSPVDCLYRLCCWLAVHEVGHGGLITTAEACTVVFPCSAKVMRAAILIAIVDVRAAAILKVPARAFNAIVKALPLDFAEFLRWRVPSAHALAPVLVMTIDGSWRRLGHVIEVGHGRLIAAAEAGPIVFASEERNRRMTILVAIVDVRAAAILKVPARAFNAIVKALPLDFAEFLRRCIPSASVLAIACLRLPLRRTGCMGREQPSCSQ